MDDLVWAEYRELHCNEEGVPTSAMDYKAFSKSLLARHPDQKQLQSALERYESLQATGLRF
jgi:hypothetical protein